MGTEKNNYSYQLRRILSNHLGDPLLPLSATVYPLAQCLLSVLAKGNYVISMQFGRPVRFSCHHQAESA